MEVFANWMDFGMAWVAVIMTVLLAGIFILRRVARKGDANSRFVQWLRRVTQTLRRHHKLLGVALIAVGFVHGLYSSQSVFSFNLGTVAWVLSILLGINWLIRKPLAKHKGWMVYHRALTALFLAVIVWHIVDVGGIQAPQVLFGGNTAIENRVNAAAAPTASATSGTDSTAGADTGSSDAAAAETSTADALAALTDGQFKGAILKDGTYTGVAQAYGPDLTVSVTVKDNAITDIQIISHNEKNSRYYSTPMNVVPQEIIDGQTTDVDTVTRGTFTSVGIINAVNNALQQALVSGELPADKDLPARRGH